LDQQTILVISHRSLGSIQIQYKQKGYLQKLKANITTDFMHSGHQDFAMLLYKQVTHIDGMCIA
jgi:hypothetical protein